MEDGTIEVFEPKTFDPGCDQGRLIRRHCIPLPSPAHVHVNYTLDHLNVGCQVEFYGKTFLICGCDDKTRKYLNRLGISVPHNFQRPEDPYTVHREDVRKKSRLKRSCRIEIQSHFSLRNVYITLPFAQLFRSRFSRPAHIQLDEGKRQRFINNSGKVLRFWAYWDDRCSSGDGACGYLREFLLHFFLEDETIEIKEIHSGRSLPSSFLSRSKLLKVLLRIAVSLRGT
jgi:hypothetical protein